MRLESIRLHRYRSVLDETIAVGPLSVLIGPNAAGKSNVLDALNFLNEGVVQKDFSGPVKGRGGIIHLAWKGESANEVNLKVVFRDDEGTFEWTVTLVRRNYDIAVYEEVHRVEAGRPPAHLLSARDGVGWWFSGDKQVHLEERQTVCALATAAADAAFPARKVAEFIRGWAFFDPSPTLLRRASNSLDTDSLDPYGRNLAARLHNLRSSAPETFDRILSATRSVLGVPESLETRESEDGRVFFVQSEPGLNYSVHQIGASSGTLRMLALMTALFGEAASTFVGIEEPENYIHPSALEAFVEHLRKAMGRVQVMITTHSPLLLDCLEDPAAVCIVSRSEAEGTKVKREENPEAIRKALKESGLALGELLQTKGFGA